MTRKRANISQDTYDYASETGMTIDEIVQAHKESSDSVLRGGVGLGPSASQRADGPRPNPSTPRQTVSNDTADNGPSGPVIKAYCDLNGHLEAVTYNEDSNGERIAHVYCARCKTTTKAPAATGDYTVVAVEPTYLGSYHPDR